MPKSTFDRAIDRKPGTSGATTIISSGGSASAIVHSTLLGLLVDDHTQYLKADGTRPLTGNLSVTDTMTIDGVDISAHAANPNAHHATATEGDGIDITGQVVAVDATVVRTSRNLTAGDGLTGGGTLAADRTFALASSVAGLGLIYTTGVLAVGAGYGIAVSSDDVALSSGVAGAGLTFTTGVIDVGQGDGLTVSANDVALTTPGTLTVLTANSASGSHTHSITSSSAPGAAASILASDGTGLLTLPLFTATTSITTPLVTAVTNLQLAPSVDLQLYPVGDVLLGDGLTFRTDSFSTSYPIEGMIVAETAVAGQYGMAIGVIEADELRVRVFVADEVRIDRGSEVWAKSYGITMADFTTPGSIGGEVTITFESSPMVSGPLFSTNDWLLFRTIDIDTGIALSEIWGQVSGYASTNTVDFWLDLMPDSLFPDSSFPSIDLGTTTQDWTFTLRDGDTSYRIPEGSLGIDYGAAGQSYIEFSVTDPIAAPYIRIRRWTGSDPFSPANRDDTVYIGNLNGVDNVNLAGNRGIWVQNSAETAWAELSDAGIALRNTSIALYDGATQTVNIGASGTDFWMGTSSADKRFVWDGTSLAIVNHDLQTATSAVFFESFDSVDVLEFWTSYAGGGEIAITAGGGSAGGNVLTVGNNSGDDMAWLISNRLIPFDSGKTYRMRVRALRALGSGTVYFGYVGVAADGVTYVNVTGANDGNNQHYHAANAGNPGTSWTEYTGYTSGFGATVGTGAVGTVSSLGEMHPDVCYLRPLIVVNYNSVAGQTLIDMVSVEAISAAWYSVDGVPDRFGDAPSAAGLYLTATHLGYYNGSAWKAWIASSGEFYFGGSTGAHLEWSGTKLRGLDSSSVEQWYADSTDGKLYAAAGDVWVDVDGINIKAGTAETGFVALQWRYTGGSEPYPIEAWIAGVYQDSIEYGADSHTWLPTATGGAMMYLDGDGLAVYGAIEADSSIKLASMTTTERDALTAANGMLIYNTTDAKFQGYQAGSWTNLA